MSNNIRFQVHTSSSDDNNIGEEDNTNISSNISVPINSQLNNSNDNNDNYYISPAISFSYNRSENDSVYNIPLLVLMSMATSLNPILSDLENRPSIIVERIFQQDESLSRDPNRELQISTQTFNTTNMKFDECSICTECFEGEDTVSVLECSHIFHNKCITEWGHYSPSCPICKNTIPVQERDLPPNDFYRMLRYDPINDLD